MTDDINRYYLVKLVKGPDWKPGLSFDLLALQFRHMRNLWRLRRAKKAVLSAPLADHGEIRGIVILKAANQEEAKVLIQSDPAVQARRLSYEISEL
jgi:uncharacterized protein YciI